MKALISIIFAAAAVALVFMVARPLWDNILSLRAESAVISDNLARLQEVETLRDDLIAARNSISKSDLARLEKLLPPKANTEDLLASFETLTRARGIALKSINFSAEVSSQQLAPATQAATGGVKPPTQVSYGLSVTGSYEAFRSLLDAMEKNLRLIDMSEISFVSSDGGALTYSLKAKSYYQK
ncbi:MAG: hypothetical protein UW30_C0015G0031 [Candidatus Giovannonibacteria bacterium GW2011_GWA2_44_13b]|uniref:Pilus assembly protein, PilO n=2 Tax=Candidatus Giovannoniibacteriota TaxID=1752738 RepID=A0A0G1H289_9BACT|nr:MAG: hypothetical protein UW30_C0015G0031 [Candidatus Giovannonibacteria bacterium GW2011_GWA2_44_13b]OGF82468.1 MAG: hypothetical protein A2924_01270 [Candidatus Giovannonibacteria bacterium RIFCSPLOWO2_01_FULL_44_16]